MPVSLKPFSIKAIHRQCNSHDALALSNWGTSQTIHRKTRCCCRNCLNNGTRIVMNFAEDITLSHVSTPSLNGVPYARVPDGNRMCSFVVPVLSRLANPRNWEHIKCLHTRFQTRDNSLHMFRIAPPILSYLDQNRWRTCSHSLPIKRSALIYLRLRSHLVSHDSGNTKRLGKSKCRRIITS